MADQEQTLEQQIAELNAKLHSSLSDPSITQNQKRVMAEEMCRLCSRRIVERQIANEPKPIFLREVRK